MNLSFISEQNLAASVIGTLLVLTYGSIMKIQGDFASHKDTSGNNNQAAIISQSQSYSSSYAQKDETILAEPGIYEIKIPEKFSFAPECVSRVLQAGGLDAPYRLCRYQSVDNVSTYEVSYTRFPSEIFQNRSTQEFMDNLRNGELRQFPGTLKDEKTVNLDLNLLKRDLEIESRNKGDAVYIKTTFIISKPYIYLIRFTSSNRSNLFANKTKAFFDSFRLTQASSPQTIMIDSIPSPDNDKFTVQSSPVSSIQSPNIQPNTQLNIQDTSLTQNSKQKQIAMNVNSKNANNSNYRSDIEELPSNSVRLSPNPY
ncbi:MAG: hypothetical protein ACK481_02105 [Candidatus Melainabacteria bacterium]